MEKKYLQGSRNFGNKQRKILFLLLKIYSLLFAFCFTYSYAAETNGNDFNLLETQQTSVKISGKVADQTTGEALAGVSIIEKGTSNGIASDLNGGLKQHLVTKIQILIKTYKYNYYF